MIHDSMPRRDFRRAFAVVDDPVGVFGKRFLTEFLHQVAGAFPVFVLDERVEICRRRSVEGRHPGVAAGLFLVSLALSPFVNEAGDNRTQDNADDEVVRQGAGWRRIALSEGVAQARELQQGQADGRADERFRPGGAAAVLAGVAWIGLFDQSA